MKPVQHDEPRPPKKTKSGSARAKPGREIFFARPIHLRGTPGEIAAAPSASPEERKPQKNKVRVARLRWFCNGFAKFWPSVSWFFWGSWLVMATYAHHTCARSKRGNLSCHKLKITSQVGLKSTIYCHTITQFLTPPLVTV
jgi:hypothetical protein